MPHDANPDRERRPVTQPVMNLIEDATRQLEALDGLLEPEQPVRAWNSKAEVTQIVNDPGLPRLRCTGHQPPLHLSAPLCHELVTSPTATDRRVTVRAWLRKPIRQTIGCGLGSWSQFV
ncbi:MAG: hypothetical protein KC609_23185 [Myxococcales bacterium]|nr:hypothetical protein [Myxococcales bacterium]